MTQPTILTIDKLERKDLPATLEAIQDALQGVSPLEYLMLDWWNAPGKFVQFGAGLNALKAKPAGECIGGGAFGQVVDVSWRQIGDTFRVVLVAESDVSALLDPAQSGGGKWKPEPDEANRVVGASEIKVILWGTKHAGDDNDPIAPSKWVEGRIPRSLEYPIAPMRVSGKGELTADDFEAVILHLVAYVDSRGRAVVYRRCGLKAQLESVKRRQKRLEGRGLNGDGEDTAQPAEIEPAQAEADASGNTTHDAYGSGADTAAAPASQEEIEGDAQI